MNGEKCFTFFWKLENINYSLQKKGNRIESPAFVVDAIDGTKWTLVLYPRGRNDADKAGFFLLREADSAGAETVEIKFELSFVSKDGSLLKTYGVVPGAFPKGIGRGSREFQRLEDVYIPRRTAFQPENILMARCRIWKIVGDMTKDYRCTALTHIGVEKRSLKWNVTNFSTLEIEKKCTYQIESIENNVPLMSVDLFITGGNSEGIILFDLSIQDNTIKYSVLRLFLIDGSGNRVECNQEEIRFDDAASCHQLTFSFTKKKLLGEKNKYLSNDTLSLHWQWAFSRGIVFNEIEEDEYGCICPEVKFSDAQTINSGQATRFSVLADNMKSLYDEHYLSDVKLKTDTSMFPAHKLILGASSSVFKAMFSNDMREKDGDTVKIVDFSDDTVSRMLLFIYTTRVEDLSWESASHLYTAADRYAILSLKNICSSFLKDNLSPSNACEALLTADLYADADLKSDVQDYFLKNGKQITKSDEWKDLKETNAKLAAEIVDLVFK